MRASAGVFQALVIDDAADDGRLSSLKDRHIDFLGRHLFDIKAGGPGRGPRPLRDPDVVEPDEER